MRDVMTRELADEVVASYDELLSHDTARELLPYQKVIRTYDELVGAVAKGAVHMDEVRPSWYGEVDVFRLSLASGTDCVIGQVADAVAECSTDGYSRTVSACDTGVEYCDGPDRLLTELGVTSQLGVEMGFCLSTYEGYAVTSRFASDHVLSTRWDYHPWRVLDAAWRDEIVRRRKWFADA